MKRVMVNLADAYGALLEARAKKEKRSASSYIGLLIEKDLAAAGLIEGTPHAELLAAAEEIGIDRALTAVRRATLHHLAGPKSRKKA